MKEIENIKIYGSNEFENNIIKCINKSKNNITYNNLSYEEVKNGIIIPIKDRWISSYGGVVNENLDFIELSQRSFGYSKHMSSNSTYELKGADKSLDYNNIKYIDSKVVYLGIGFDAIDYGHTVLESLNRLWYLLDKSIDDYKVAFITPISDDCIELLNLFGVKKENILVLENPTKFKCVIVPEESFHFSKLLFNNQYKIIMNKIKENVKASKYDRVYFSRDRLNRKKTLTEYPIELTFKKNGYKVFYPEKLSVYEKISIMKGCKNFAGFGGSNIIHLLFMEDNSKLIYLVKEDVEIFLYEYFSLKNFNVYAISANNNFLSNCFTDGPFLLGGNDYLFNFFEENNFKYDKEKFKYKPYELADYVFLWQNTYNKHINHKSNFKEISNDYISKKLQMIKMYDIAEEKEFLFIGIIKTIGDSYFKRAFVIKIFGHKILTINLK